MKRDIGWHKTKEVPFAIFPYGESAFLLQWDQQIDKAINEEVMDVDRLLQKDEKVIETVPAYASILVIHRRNIVSFSKCYEDICTQYLNANKENSSDLIRHLFEIPVCYDYRFCHDLEEFHNINGLSLDDILNLHSEKTYHVYMLGFLPGFVFMGSVDPKLRLPRKATPRKRIERGSVAIAGEQTGIYPMESPGGWNIVGRTPIPLFLPKLDPPILINGGDKVKFKPIDIEEYFELKESYLHDNLDLNNYKTIWQG